MINSFAAFNLIGAGNLVLGTKVILSSIYSRKTQSILY